MLKYLIIASVLALLLLLLYSKLHPYIKMLGKIVGTVKTIANSGSVAGASTRSKVDGKLIRCVSCGTWVPADRAIGSRVGASSYCSRACLEKPSNGKERKIAG